MDSMPVIGIALAVASALALSFGNIWQSLGVTRATANRGNGSMVRSLLRTRIWLIGSVMFGLAVLLQMSSLAFAPIMLVQPIGVLALVFAIFLNSKFSGKRPSREVLRSVGITLVGVTVYVLVASFASTQKAISDGQLIAILSALGGALLLALVARLLSNRGLHRAPITYVLLAGVFSAFVATLGKTVILRIQAIFAGHHFSLGNGGWLTIACVVGIGIAAALSIYFTQNAYARNPSDVVVAGLTVVDPAIAVMLGILILHEAAGAPIWSLFVIVIAGAITMYGVFRLAKVEGAAPTTQTSVPEAASDTAPSA